MAVNVLNPSEETQKLRDSSIDLAAAQRFLKLLDPTGPSLDY